MNPLDAVDLPKTLANLEDRIFEANNSLESAETAIASKREETRLTLGAKQKALEVLAVKKVDLIRAIDNLQGELKTINKDISERKLYLIEQEQVIASTTAGWNEQLSTIRGELAKTNNEHTEMLKNIVRLEQKSNELDVSIDQQEQKLVILAESYEQRAEDYRNRLKSLNIQEQDKQNKLSEMDIVVEVKERGLRSRQKTIEVTEIVQTRKAEELQQKERKLRLDYRLADQTYE